MQKTFSIALLIALYGIIACNNSPTPSAAQKPQPPLDSLLANYHQERRSFFPLEATSAGVPGFNNQFPNTISQAYRSALRDFYTKYKSSLLSYDRAQLSENHRTSYDILLWECDINLEDLQFPTELTPINQFDCLPLIMGQFAGGTAAQPFKTVKDYDDWLQRVDGFVVWCDTAIANMRRGMASGYVLPKTLAEKMAPQMAAFDHGPAEKHLYYSPIVLMPKEIPTADRERLTAAYTQMVNNKIIPLYQRMHAFVKEEYIPVCRASSGISRGAQRRPILRASDQSLHHHKHGRRGDFQARGTGSCAAFAGNGESKSTGGFYRRS